MRDEVCPSLVKNFPSMNRKTGNREKIKRGRYRETSSIEGDTKKKIKNRK